MNHNFVDRKLRKMYRGCGKAKICEDYEDQEQANIQFKVLTCSECNEHFCNSIDTIHRWISTRFVTFLACLILTLVQ